MQVDVAGRVDSRRAILRALLRSYLWLLRVALPPLALLGCWAVRRGLAPLQQLSEWLARRKPHSDSGPGLRWSIAQRIARTRAAVLTSARFAALGGLQVRVAWGA